MQIQSKLASTIAMAFDECPSSVAERSYIQQSCARTVRWLYRCRDEMARLNGEETTINRKQLLFGINQGGIYEDIRIENMKRSPSWNWTAMRSVVWPSARARRRCDRIIE